MYITADDLYSEWGRINIRAWADVNGSGDDDEIDENITAAINDAEGIVNEALAQGPYEIPLQGTSFTIQNILRGLVAQVLYTLRGSLDEQDKFKYRFDQANKLLNSIASGTVRIPCARRADCPEIPI